MGKISHKFLEISIDKYTVMRYNQESSKMGSKPIDKLGNAKGVLNYEDGHKTERSGG